jgi:hypothetical protein
MRESDQNYNLHSNWLFGIKGWLKFWIIIMGYFSILIILGLISKIVKVNSILNQFNTLFTFLLILKWIYLLTFVCLTYMLIKKRKRAVEFTKIFFVSSPFLITLYLGTIDYFSSYSEIFQIENLGFYFLSTVAISLPPFLYFSKSERVKNTYLLTEKKFPMGLNCPFCMEELELNEEEQLSKNVVCPNCNNNFYNIKCSITNKST